MSPSIDLCTLALYPPDLNAAFASHQPATRAYLAWDTFALLIGAFINVVIGRYLIKRGAMPGELPFLAGIMLLQAWQAALMHWAPDAYARHRTSICVANRAIRIGGVVGRFWPVAGSPTGCQAYAQALLIIRTHSPTRALAMLALLDPCMSFIHSVFFPLPFRVAVLVSLARSLVDVALVAPALGCMLQRQELQGTLGALLAPLRLGGSNKQPSQLPSIIAGQAFFIPSAALLLLGVFTPLFTTFWFELHHKLQFLRSLPPPVQLPGAHQLQQLRTLQLLNGAAFCLSYAGFLATLAPVLTPLACRPAL